MNIVAVASSAIFIFLFWLFYSGFFGAEFYPTASRKMKKMLEFAALRKKDISYDLGCGDGRLVIAAARKCKRAVGIEIDFFRFLFSFLKVKILGLKNAKIILGNFFRQDFRDADVVFLFLRQKANDRLQKKLSKLKKGTRIVSHYWVFHGWKPVKQDRKLKVYLYVVGKSNRRNV